ncbi:MAG: ABC transporter ATP-binding protein [Arcanobacterium sp.]|nr:ABC transporter ATP-binding protein [Arcanobacterium sp.]
MSLIKITDLHRTVTLPDNQELKILRGVNLEVAAGDQISVVGRSGTGKSTLLNIIGLLDKQTSGEYLVNGNDATKFSESDLSRLRGDTFGFVFQQFNLFNNRNAVENVEIPLLYDDGQKFWKRRKLASEMLERVGLGDRLNSHPGEMSGGEQQRIAIARALVRQPKVILADEPTGALDPETGLSVIELLEEVARDNNAALIIITHDMNIAARTQRKYILEAGVLS